MQNEFIYKLKSKVKIQIKGRRVEHFLKRIMSSKIELLDIKYVNRNEILVLIYKKDYTKVLELKSIYDIDIIDYKGLIKVKKIISINKVLIIFSIFGLALLLGLSQVIFSVEVIHNNKEIRFLLLKELSNYGIEPKKFKKTFSEIEKIKIKILEKHRDKIEWLEIENNGTKYIVKVEERKIVDLKQDYTKQNIIAKKSAILKKVFAKNGVIIKNTDEYVKKGDVVISGEILLNETVKDTIKAEGEIYGEVWYNIKVEYPYVYSEQLETGNKKEVYTIKVLDNSFELLNFSKYKNKRTEDKILLKHLFLPISFVKQKQREVKIIEYVVTTEEAINKAMEKGRLQIESKLKDNEHIITEKQLKVDIKESKIVLDMFYAIYEDITDYAEIINNNLE